MTNRREEWTPREKLSLVKMKMQGLPSRFISERLGRSVDAIEDKWREIRQFAKPEPISTAPTQRAP